MTVTEFLLVKALAIRPGHVKSRDQLMDAAYGEHIYVDDRTIDSHIKRLRKKFKVGDVIDFRAGLTTRWVKSLLTQIDFTVGAIAAARSQTDSSIDDP